MEYTAYLMGITSQDIQIDRLFLKSRADALEITCRDAANPGVFSKMIHLLQTGLIIYGYEHDWKALIDVSKKSVVKEIDEQKMQRAIEISDHIWKEITWVFQSRDQLAAYWFGVSVSADEVPKKYVAMYYAAKELKENNNWPETAIDLLEQLKKAADDARLDEEALGEQGLEKPDITFDMDLLKEAERIVIGQIQK